MCARSSILAPLADPTHLHCNLLRQETVLLRAFSKWTTNVGLHELANLAARVADREDRHILVPVVGVVAKDECVETFNPMGEAHFDQFVQCTIDLQRGVDAVLAQPGKKRVCTLRDHFPRQRVENQRLVTRQVPAIMWWMRHGKSVLASFDM